jgi:AraC-like DNA-binding protein
VSAQTHIERLPAPRLAGLVSSVWIQRAGDAPYLHRDVPHGCVQVVCAVGGAPKIAGPRTSPLIETLSPGTVVAGVRFLPGTAPLLRIPAAELADTEVPADLLWGSQAAAAGERIAAGEHPVPVLQQLVISRLAAAPALPPLIPITHISERQISERQYRRRFHAAVGVAPQAFRRIRRFQGFLARVQHALAQGQPPAPDGLAMLAAEAGYADQSHLGRECLRLTGLTPRAFLRQTQQQCGDGHEHAVSFRRYLAMSGPF